MFQDTKTLTWKSISLFAAVLALQGALLAALAVAPASARDSVQVMKETILLKPESVMAGQREQPTVPFAGGHEKKAAHTVMLGEDPAVPSIDVINYAVKASDKGPGSRLMLDCTLSKPEDVKTLDMLADRIYRENSGHTYENVTINWRVGSNPEIAAPWARTSIVKTGAVTSMN